LIFTFGEMVHLDPAYIKFEGQGHRTQFKVTRGNCCQSGRCDLKLVYSIYVIYLYLCVTLLCYLFSFIYSLFALK